MVVAIVLTVCLGEEAGPSSALAPIGLGSAAGTSLTASLLNSLDMMGLDGVEWAGSAGLGAGLGAGGGAVLDGVVVVSVDISTALDWAAVPTAPSDLPPRLRNDRLHTDKTQSAHRKNKRVDVLN